MSTTRDTQTACRSDGMKIDIEIGWVLGTTLCFLGIMAVGGVCAVAKTVTETAMEYVRYKWGFDAKAIEEKD